MEERESPIYRKMEDGYDVIPEAINQFPMMYYNYCGWQVRANILRNPKSSKNHTIFYLRDLLFLFFLKKIKNRYNNIRTIAAFLYINEASISSELRTYLNRKIKVLFALMHRYIIKDYVIVYFIFWGCREDK